MMTTQSSKTIIWLKKLAVMPLLAGFVFLFAERVEAQEKIEVIEETKTPINKDYIDSPIKNDAILSPNQYNIVPFETKPIKDNPINTNVGTVTDIRLKLKDVNFLKIEYLEEVTPKEMKIYKTLLAKGKKSNIYKQKDILKMQDIYKRMSKKQKNSVENVSELIPPPPPPKPDWVYTYKKLASKVKRTSENRKANLIRLEEIYNKKMIDEERAKVIAPEKLQVPPPPAKQQASTIDKSTPEYHYTKQTFWIKNKNGKKIAKKYHELSDYYKKKWLLFPPNTYTKKQISNTEFQSLKNNDKYVVKIGGVTAKKGELNKYRATDFVSFSKAEISKLAGLKQKYQYNLYTENYLKTTKTLGVFSYNSALKRYQENLKLKLNNKKINENQFKKDFTFLSKMYRTFTKEMVSENNLKLPSPPPPKKVSSSFIKNVNKKTSLVFNSLDEVKKQKETESKLNDDEKRQFLLRKTIIQATTLKEDNFNFKIDGKTSEINEVYKYLHKNPLCIIDTKEEKSGVLTVSLDKFQKKKMSSDNLQNVYSKVFKRTK